MKIRTRYAISGAILVAAIVWVLGKTSTEPGPIANSSEFALTDLELQSLPSAAKEGNCEAATRLGIFYFAVLGKPEEAEQWLRLSDSCSRDPRVKEFLLNCISYKEPSRENVEDVQRILRELDVIDPPRSQRMRLYVVKDFEVKSP
jgi:hypothetical protein